MLYEIECERGDAFVRALHAAHDHDKECREELSFVYYETVLGWAKSIEVSVKFESKP